MSAHDFKFNPTPIYDAAAWDHGFAPMDQPTVPANCYRCVNDDMAATGPTDGLCWGCRAEVQANRDDARDELVSTLYTGHGLGHVYRADVAL